MLIPCLEKGVKLKFLRKEKEIEHKLGCSRKIGEVQGFKDIWKDECDWRFCEIFSGE